MAERTLPGLGLTGFWDLGANNWKDGMDANLRLLSVIARGWAKSRTTTIPADGAAGDVYVVPSDAAAEANSIAIWDGVAGSEQWVYVPPQIGLRFFMQDDGKNYQWDGTEWTLLAAGGSGGTGGSVLRPFAAYPTNADGVHTDAVSTTAFALKGNLYGCTEDLTLVGIDVYIDNDTEGGNYELHVLQVDNSTLDVAVVTAVSSLTFSEVWTAAAMAKEVGISISSVQRIWRAHKLQPHRIRTFKLSRDPQFVAKLQDIVGLYVDPPAHAIVLSVDEKSQIQALDRTQPGLPIKPGRCGTLTHDYKRNGTTTLFAALDVLEGKVIGQCMQRHRHQEFIRFLNAIEAKVPAGKMVHVILDNYATHKHPKVMAWLTRHPRFVFHFTPTSCSWLNAVESFFAKLTKRRLKRGVFHSIVDLQAAIKRFLEEHNDNPKPFVWTAEPDHIIAAVNRGHQALELIH